MQIDIQPSTQIPGKWVVIAHSPSGDIHDGLFSSQAEALEFVDAVYGIGKIIPVKRAPKTTAEKIRHYCTTRNSCQCQDRRNGGGSYLDERGRRICKHINHVRMEDFRIANAVADTWQKQEHIDREGNLLELPVPAVPAKTAAPKLTAEELFARLRA